MFKKILTFLRLKKKSIDDLFLEAALDIEKRKEFTKAMADEAFYFPVQKNNEGNKVRLLIELKGEKMVPFFTHPQRAMQFFKKEYNVSLTLAPLRKLIDQLPKNKTLILNPGSLITVRFTIQQIEAVLDGSALKELEKPTVPDGTKFKFFPSNASKKDIVKLTEILNLVDGCKSAYSCNLHRNEKPHLCIGVEMETDDPVVWTLLDGLIADYQRNHKGLNTVLVNMTALQSTQSEFVENIKKVGQCFWSKK